MLFIDFDASYNAIHQHPMITVIEGVRSVANHDPKHMCKECKAYKLCYQGVQGVQGVQGDISTDTVYVLRNFVKMMKDITRISLFIRHPTLMMNVARFIVDPDRVHKQRSSAPGKQ